MAERRMFHTAVVESDAFLDMTPAAQALYFHLGMNADDDGFVNGPRQVCRTLGAPIECLQELIDGNFLLWFDGVGVLTHFRLANTLQNDRIKQLRYPEIAKKIYIQSNRIYTLEPGKRKDNLYYLRTFQLRQKGIRLDSKRIPKGKEGKGTEKKGTEQNIIEGSREEENVGAATDRPDTPAATYDDEQVDMYIPQDSILFSQEREGVVHLTPEECYRLLTTMGYQHTRYYIQKLVKFIKERKANIKDHYATILKWWEEDGGTYL